MSAFVKARSYHALADVCVRLAEHATDSAVRAHYRKIAENYLAAARAEFPDEQNAEATR
jgi:hypothetical protein